MHWLAPLLGLTSKIKAGLVEVSTAVIRDLRTVLSVNASLKSNGAMAMFSLNRWSHLGQVEDCHGQDASISTRPHIDRGLRVRLSRRPSSPADRCVSLCLFAL